MNRRALAVLVLALASMFVAGAAVEGADGASSNSNQDQPICPSCHGKGLVDCPKCGKDKCGDKHEVAFCSIAANCKLCGGTKLVPCKCKGKPALDLGAKRDALRTWLKTKAEPINKFMGRELAQAESKHFHMVWDVPSVDEKGAENIHRAMHLFLEGLEDFADRFEKELGCKTSDFSSKTTVMVWSKAADQSKAALEYTNQTSDTECKLMGKAPVFTLFYDKGHMHEASELHQALVHQASHCLLSNVFDGVWPGNIKGGWLDEGLAHWFEITLFDGVRHYCYVEQDNQINFKFGRWESSVRAGVDAGKAPAPMSIMCLDTNSMTPEQHMYAWSVLDCVMRAHHDQFAEIVKRVKKKEPATDYLPAVLSQNAFQFDADWRAFVTANYSNKPKK